jgi:acyl carrier protein
MSEGQFSVRLALAEAVGEQQLETADPDDLLVDLGLDSITLIVFVLKLEGYLGYSLSLQQIALLRGSTLGEVVGLVASWTGESRHPEARPARPGRSDEAKETTPLFIVRPFRECDRGELAELCRQTCAYPWLREMAHLLWLYQYLDQEPEACFVAETEGHVAAYWVGTASEPALAAGFRAHVWRYRSEFVRLYPALLGQTLSPRRHIWFWRIMIEAMVHPRRAFRLYNRRDLVGPILGRARAHFQVVPGGRNAGAVFELARAWLCYLAAKQVDITCLPGFPGGAENEEEAADYWRRIGYHRVRFGDRTVLIALVRSDEVRERGLTGC